MKSFASLFSLVCAVFAAVALLCGFGAHLRRIEAQIALDATRRQEAALLSPAIARDEAWRDAALSFPRVSGRLPALFSAPGCRKVHERRNFAAAAGGYLAETGFSFDRVSLDALENAVDGARKAGFRPVAIRLDALPGASVRCEISLAGIEGSE
ncbi:MAG: hypothetical protein IJS46_00885 [Kiritimatiellae bacterium]|nr:hypothetical protein [Kiritimatiellia bacterium]